ncbi:MAG: 16S rRNA (cytosine(967)-C(5))-methyltransferase RsmB [Lactobacillales bacterium]|jgi:16S rRNA (cytosine967-C5)-methyltransferase|nr:16S rRNA (cytosine(967)-C(5))-methyltransferase RsmB [Lactobacillales bacterium]
MKPDIKTRQDALSVLEKVIDRGLTLENAFYSILMDTALSPLDKRFVRALVMSVLRRFGQAENILTRYLKKPLPQKQRKIYLILIMGIVSLYFLKTPAHAVVHVFVELSKLQKPGDFSKLVNAILRQVSRDLDTLAAPAVSLNIPDWLYASWVKDWGEPHAQSIANAVLSESPIDLSVIDDPKEWAGKLNATVLPEGTVRLNDPVDITSLPGYSDGLWWVQDAAASIPAQLFSDINGKRVADICAAPGGKTAQLVAFGAHVTAYDISEKRLKRFRENMHRLGFDEKVTVVCTDMLTDTDVPKEQFDAVLLDAPCSATGTLMKHPDVKFHKGFGDILRLSEMQKALLLKAIAMTKPGGEIVYVTCSMQRAEGEDVLQTILKESPDIQITPMPDRFSNYKTPEGFLRTFPDQERDGFFIAKLIKK